MKKQTRLRFVFDRASAIGVALLICAAGWQTSHAVHPGVYVCAVDNCKKQYPGDAVKPFEACREGVSRAVRTAPASAECKAMCESYPASDGVDTAACLKGCALFPSRCLRHGELPPIDDYARDRFRP